MTLPNAVGSREQAFFVSAFVIIITTYVEYVQCELWYETRLEECLSARLLGRLVDTFWLFRTSANYVHSELFNKIESAVCSLDYKEKLIRYPVVSIYI